MNILALTEREREILSAVYLNAGSSAQEIARTVGTKTHSVHYALNKFRAQGLITLQPFINTYAFGYYQAEFFASLGVSSEKAKERFERAIVSSPRVPWLGRYGGSFQYGFTFCANNFDEIFNRAGRLLEGVSDIIRDQLFGIRKNYTEFQFKNLSRKKFGPPALSFGMTSEVYEIDETDHKLLKALCQNPDFSRNTLADKIGIQPSTVHYRIASLEKRGILCGFTYVVDFGRLGFLTYLYLLRLHSPGEKHLTKIRRFAEEHPDIIYMSEGLGGWDIQLAANVREPEDSMRIARALAEHFGELILDLQTLSAFAYSKVVRYPFVEIPGNA